MANELYDLPPVVALALQSQRGELLKALGPSHAEELLKVLDKDRFVQLLNLIADLIDDRYKLKCEVHDQHVKTNQLGTLLDEAQRSFDNLKQLIRGSD